MSTVMINTRWFDCLGAHEARPQVKSALRALKGKKGNTRKTRVALKRALGDHRACTVVAKANLGMTVWS